jgi:hypothetical protein
MKNQFGGRLIVKKQDMTVLGSVLSLLGVVLMLPPVLAAEPPSSENVVRALQQRFALADKNADGQLTPEEVEGKMPYVSRNFTQIDVDKSGSVSKDELRQHAANKRTESSGTAQ